MHLTSPSGTKHITIKENESLDIMLEDFTPGNRDFSLTVTLQGQNAQCHIKGRAQTQNNDHKKWNISLQSTHHSQKGTLNLHGTAENKSQLEFDGQGLLAHDSTMGTLNVEEKILLFDDAQGRLLPTLTVCTDNVQNASHSASITPIDPQKILYLQSKGIPTDTARSLIQSGFLR